MENSRKPTRKLKVRTIPKPMLKREVREKAKVKDRGRVKAKVKRRGKDKAKVKDRAKLRGRGKVKDEAPPPRKAPDGRAIGLEPAARMGRAALPRGRVNSPACPNAIAPRFNSHKAKSTRRNTGRWWSNT